MTFSPGPSGLRVAHVGAFGHAAVNGVSQAVGTYLRALQALGAQVQHWDLTADYRDIGYTDAGYPVYHLPISSRLGRKVLGLPPVTQRFLREHLEDIDLVHLHLTFTGENPHLMRLCARAHRPFVLTPHGGYDAGRLESRALLKRVWYPVFERPMLRRAAFLHALQQQEATALQRLAHEQHIVVLPNPVPVIQEPGPFAERDVLLFIGRFDVAQKGLDLLVRAYAQARDAGLQLPLHLVGPDFRGGRDHLEALLAEKHLTGKVTLHGPVNAVGRLAWLGRARAFVAPSRHEGLPMAPLEALAAGVPLILTPGTHLDGLVEAAGAGWAVKGNESALAAALLAAEALPAAEWQHRSARACDLVEQRYSPDAFASTLLREYQYALDRVHDRRSK
ncbi:glycosyltransferase [Deinococcus sp. SDU3-2]|uniref:Glycosyltransferase n=1 Tax=Deinococcus terrestris TaxID=2651870 RepID=A0A7X1NYZ8_9DEIO|nr:glycosyltransferase [Deinococcus terrestris]